MNEQLRKAIEEATRVYPWLVPLPIGGSAIDINAHHASQAKLLRVIEMLVHQRDKHVRWAMLHRDVEKAILEFDAELIATLEGK